jgi:hypothetical protein
VKGALVAHAYTQQWQDTVGAALEAARADLAATAAAARAQVLARLPDALCADGGEAGLAQAVTFASTCHDQALCVCLAVGRR